MEAATKVQSPNQGSLVTPTDDAKSRLEACEEQIRSGWLDVALAVHEIHRDKLYLADGFETFEDYMQKRWGLSRATGNRSVKAAEALYLAVERGLVDHVRDIPPHLSQRGALALGVQLRGEHAVREGRSMTYAYPEARRILDDPARVEKENDPYQPPRHPAPGVRAILTQISRLHDQILCGYALDHVTAETFRSTGRGDNPIDPQEIIEAAEALAQIVVEKLKPVAEMSEKRPKDQEMPDLS